MKRLRTKSHAIIQRYFELLKNGTDPKKAKNQTASEFFVTEKRVRNCIGEWKNSYALGSIVEGFTDVRELNDTASVITNQRLTVLSPQEVWDKALKENELRAIDEHSIQFLKCKFEDNLPIGLTYICDLHLDDPRADLEQAEQDAETIKNTDGLYAGLGGDYLNWYIKQHFKYPKFDDPSIPVYQRVMLLNHWIDKIDEKTLFMMIGNHDFWAYGLSGLLYDRGVAQNRNIHYSKAKVICDIQVGEESYKNFFSHEYWGASKINPLHEFLRAARHAVPDYRPDAIGLGDRHDGLVASINLDGRKMTCVKSGSYKRNADDFENISHIPQSTPRMPVIIYLPDEHLTIPVDSIQYGAQILTDLRKQYMKENKDGR